MSAALLLAGLSACSSDGPTEANRPVAPTTSESIPAETTTAPGLASTVSPDVTTTSAPPTPVLLGDYRTDVITVLPHDPTSYTQGLEWHDGSLFESTGQYEQSERRRLDPHSGEVLATVPLDAEMFGEGLTVVDDEILQLTWQEGQLLRSGVDDLETTSTQSYEGEGWGLCHDGDELIMSDGSSTLVRRDATTFEITGRLEVTANGGSVSRLNELECVGNQVVANIYGSDQIVAIDADTGIVVAVIDASDLRPDGLAADDYDVVLNGIAYQPETGHWYLTGKYWPVLYEVAFIAD